MAAQVYFDDFEGPSALTGAGGIVSAQGYDGIDDISRVFWRNDSDSLATTLTLVGLAPLTTMTLEFDIAFIDSWDGAIGRIWGDDFFNIVIDGVTALITTNFGGLGDEPSAPALGFYGFTERYDDEAYRLTTTFAHSGETAVRSFFADGVRWQVGKDESWEIDNLSVSTDALAVVTVSGGLPLLSIGLGLLTLAARRRRKAL
jgi:hypothetical protein